MSIKAVQDKLRQVVTDAQAIAAKGVFSTEDSQRLEGLITEGNTLKAQIAQHEAVNGMADFAGKSAGMLDLAGASQLGMTPAGETMVERTTVNGRPAVRLLDQFGEGLVDDATFRKISSPEYKAAFRTYLRKGQNGLKSSEIRTLQEGADTEGGFLVPEDFLEKIIAKEPTPTRVAGRVTSLQTSRDALVIPKVNYAADDLYTSGIRVTWTGEVPSSSTAMRVTDPIFGQARISVQTAMMSLPLTNDQIEDTAFPLVSWVSGKFAETVDLLRDNMVLNGSGQGQPYGLFLAPGAVNQPAVVTSGNANLITAAGLVSTAFALPEQYDDAATWVMNKTSTAAAIAGLVDSNGRYLWGSGLQDSGLVPSIKDRKLLGYDVLLSGFAPSVAASAYVAIFGDLKGYYLLNRVGFSIQVLRELYAETNQVLILGRLRFGGIVAEPWRLKVHQVHA
jgi:HK97 family phage major capsid protein